MTRKLAEKVGWPLAALAAAFALWVTFVGSPEIVGSISVPVHYENMPAKLEPATELPQHVLVDIQGPSARLGGFSGAHTAAVVDLAGIETAGERTITIDPKSIDMPVGVRVVRVQPAQVRLRFERCVEAEVPVSVRFSAPPGGYRVASALVHPPTLTITGAESRVRQVRAVETDPLDLSRVVGQRQFRVPAFLEDEQVRFVSTPLVQVSVTLEKAIQGGKASDGKAAVRN
jgi:YbbR domain-containing protein